MFERLWQTVYDPEPAEEPDSCTRRGSPSQFMTEFRYGRVNLMCSSAYGRKPTRKSDKATSYERVTTREPTQSCQFASPGYCGACRSIVCKLWALSVGDREVDALSSTKAKRTSLLTLARPIPRSRGGTAGLQSTSPARDLSTARGSRRGRLRTPQRLLVLISPPPASPTRRR